MLKLDLHLHSYYSDDGIGAPEDFINVLQKRGLHGMALTDHNTIEGSLKAIAVAPKNFIVIPSVEITTLDGHLLALNVTKNIPRSLSVEEAVEHIIDVGGIPIVPHLFRLLSGIKKSNLQKIHSKLVAIEVFNACSLPKTNLKIARTAHALNLGGTGEAIPIFRYMLAILTPLSTPPIYALIQSFQKYKRKEHGVKGSPCRCPTGVIA